MIELVGIERNTFNEMQTDFEKFAEEMRTMLNRGADTDKRLGEWVDSKYVCDTLKISQRTLQTFRDNGKLAYTQIERKIFYKPEDVQAILQDVEDYKKDAIWRKRSKHSK
jgi:hypothetical protein